MKEVVTVQFQSRFTGEFGGRDYSYYAADGLDLKVGEIVEVDTRNGVGLAKVTKTGLGEWSIAENVKPHMKTITSRPQE